jgi:hypothetical protein
MRNDFRDFLWGVSMSFARWSLGGYWNMKRRLKMSHSEPLVSGTVVGEVSLRDGMKFEPSITTPF